MRRPNTYERSYKRQFISKVSVFENNSPTDCNRNRRNEALVQGYTGRLHSSDQESHVIRGTSLSSLYLVLAAIPVLRTGAFEYKYISRERFEELFIYCYNLGINNVFSCSVC